MSAEQNITIVRRYYEECANDRGDREKASALAVVDEILSPNFSMCYCDQNDSEAVRGKDQHKEFLLGHTQAFPGERWTVEGLVADEHTVASRVRVEATHAETGNPMTVRIADFFAMEDGRISELRRYMDFQSMAQQMQPKSAPQDASSSLAVMQASTPGP